MTGAKSPGKATPTSAHEADLLAETSLAGSAQAPGNQDTPLDFERALADLEVLVQQLESGELSLEQGLEAYRRGVQLVRQCQERLEHVEQQVKVLEADLLRPLVDDDLRGDA